jgi:hypothetical protein
MVFMPVGPFLGDSPGAERDKANKLRFRAIPDSLAQRHLEGSECCLIHADNPLSATHGVYLNPNVRVSYNGSVYDALHAPRALMSPFAIWRRVWANRILRWCTTVLFKEGVVESRVRAWRAEGKRAADPEMRSERGRVCLINEMQVLHERGWRHV